MTTNDLITLHHALVREWNTHGPCEVHYELSHLTHEELVQLAMMHTGKSAMLSPK